MSSLGHLRGRWWQSCQVDGKGRRVIGRWHWLPTAGKVALCGRAMLTPYKDRDHRKGNCRECEDLLLGSTKEKGPVLGGTH